MSERPLRDILEAVAGGELTVDAAADEVTAAAYIDLGFAKVDHGREGRTGVAEVVYCAGKTPAQAGQIVEVMLRRSSGPVLATHADAEHARAILEVAAQSQWHPEAGVVVARSAAPASAFVVVVMTAGTSDIPVAEEAAITLEALGHQVRRVYDVGAAGAHRLVAATEPVRDADMVIVCAGMDGVLPTLVAGLFGGPIVAVPTSIGYGAGAGGIAPLLAMLNSCAPGVAVVNIDNGFGAATFASLVLTRRAAAAGRGGAAPVRLLAASS